MKRLFQLDGFVKNIELGDAAKILLRSMFTGWYNTASYASITVHFLIIIVQRQCN